MSNSKIIDVWMQHPTKRLLEQPMFDSLKRWVGGLPEEIPLEMTIKAMDVAGVGKGLICAWYAPEGALISNEEVLRCVTKYPERFIGIVGVDLSQPVPAISELRQYVQEHNFKGLRIVQWLWDKPCTHPLYYPLLATCVELDIPICLQVGLTGPLKTSETGRPIHIERIALDFPNLKIICGHLGYPWHLEMIAFATKFPNVYIDTSAYKPQRYPRELVDYLKHHGRTKVMFGSNYPMIQPHDCVKEFENLGLDEEALQLFLWGNAARVFGIS